MMDEDNEVNALLGNEELPDVLNNPLGNDNDVVAMAAAIVMGFLLVDMEEEEEEEGGEQDPEEDYIVVNIEAWRNLGELAFHSHFRMSKELFEILLQTMGNHLTDMGRIQRIRTPLHIALLGSLWILATIDTFRSTSIKFNMSPGVLHYHYRYVIEALRELAPRFISWPQADERVRIKETFFRRTGYPDCVGAIDGTHIYVTAPLIDAQTYVNRFMKYSIVAQAVADSDMVVRDLCVGEPGSMHDARIFSRSPLGRRLYLDPTMLSEEEHIIGDGAYMLTDKLQTPFRNNGLIDPVRARFNTTLSATRSIVERTFGRLKGKFRRLKHFHSCNLEYAVDHIVSSFVLHNFILLDGIPYNEEVLEDIPADEAGPLEGLDRNGPILLPARAAGVAMRTRNAARFAGIPE